MRRADVSRMSAGDGGDIFGANGKRLQGQTRSHTNYYFGTCTWFNGGSEGAYDGKHAFNGFFHIRHAPDLIVISVIINFMWLCAAYIIIKSILYSLRNA